MSKTKYKKQNKKYIKKIINNKIKVVAEAYLSGKQKVDYMIPTMNCYPRNG